MKVRRLIAATASVALATCLIGTVGSAGGELPPQLDPPKPLTIATPGPPSAAQVLARKLTKEHERYLAAQRHYLAARHRVHSLLRTLQARPSTGEAINLACTAFAASCSQLWRVARCESGYSPRAHNRSGASGLFQFLPSTFAGTPFGRFSIWSPYANALAAGWMMARGRAGEWVCR